MVVLVTGASVGFGREIAKIFAKNGHKVIALARRKEKLESLQKEIGNCAIIACDICDREALKLGLKSLPKEYQEIDVLVNNAGLALGLQRASECNIEDWDQVVGHTPVIEDIINIREFTKNNRNIWLCDALNISKYLIIDNNEFIPSEFKK